MATPCSVLVAGSANLDFVVRAPHVPAPGETVLGHAFATFAGGKGANQAVACARAGGVQTRMLLGLGCDAFAAPIEASLARAGVQTLVLRFEREATGLAFITVGDNGENAITVAPGANAALQEDDLPPLDGVHTLALQLETPLPVVAAWSRRARQAGVCVMLNAAPARTLDPALLGQVDVLVVNQLELATLAGAAGNLDAQLQRLPVPAVVVTLGAQGCLARVPEGRYQLPALPVTVVDTTAAGDTFCGVLAASRSRGLDWPSALLEASVAAALACTRPGAQSSIPSRAEVLARLARIRG